MRSTKRLNAVASSPSSSLDWTCRRLVRSPSPFALRHVLHGFAHHDQWLHEHADQHAQQQDDQYHGNQRGDDGRSAKLAEHRVGLVLVDGQADIPRDRGQAFDRGEGENARISSAFNSVSLKAELIRGVSLG